MIQGAPAEEPPSLKERLAAHQRAVDALVALIPAAHYLPPQDSLLDPHFQGGRFAHNKKNKAPKQIIKENTKRAKRLKLDPDTPKTVPELQERMIEKEALAKDSNNSDNDDDDDDDDDDEETAIMDTDADTAVTDPDASVNTLHPMPAARTPAELHDRLHRRIQELRARRSGSISDDDHAAAVANTLDSNDNIANPVPSTPTVPKSRQDIIEKRKLRKEQRKEALQRKRESRRRADDTKGMTVTPKKPVESTEIACNMSFGKLDFGEDPSKTGKKKGPSDALGLLRKVEAKKASLDKLKETNAEKARKIEESQKWDAIAKRAEGTKVKDDISLLKKSVKRIEQRKKKSSGDWKDRLDRVEQDQTQKQKRRQDNIRARIDANAARKIDKRKGGSGRVSKKTAGAGGASKRPGFEGGMRKTKSK